MPGAKLTSLSHLGLAVESVLGTPVAATGWAPIMKFTPQDLPQWVADQGFRGQATRDFGQYLGLESSTYDLNGMLYPDSGGNFLAAVMGAESTSGTTSGASTTLASAATAGSTTISTVATESASTVIQIDTGSLSEVHTVSSVSGAGPYTLTLDTPLLFSHTSGATVQPVVAPFTHTFTNAAYLPSYTLSDYYVAGARQFPGARCEKLALKFTPEAGLSYTANFLGFPSVTYSPGTTRTYETDPFFLGWEAALSISSSPDVNLSSLTVTLTRDKSKTLWSAQNSQNPYDVFVGPLVAEWDAEFYMNSDTEYLLALSQATKTVSCTLTQPGTNHTLTLTSTAVQFQKPTIDRGQDYVIVRLTGDAVYNATDGGPVQMALANSLSGQYIQKAVS